jgi:WD40 repeat protein
MLAAVGAALLAGVTPGPPSAEPPPPLVNVTGGAVTFVERRGDYHMRHQAMGYAVADDGAFGATGSYDGTAVVWDLRDGRAVRVFETPHINVNAVALSRDGSRLATGGGADGTVRMWDVRAGSELWSSKHDADALRFSPDGKRLIGRHIDEHRVWEVSDGRLVWRGLSHRSGQGGYPGAFGTIVMPGGRSAIELVVTGWHGAGGGDNFYVVPDGYVATVVDLDGAALPRVLSNPDWPSALATSPSGDRVAIVGQKELIVVDAASGRRLAAVARPDNGNPIVHRTGVLLVSDPRFAVTWDLDELVAWDLPAGRPAWRQRRGKGDSAPWLAGKDTLFVMKEEECVGLGVADGKTRWRRAGCRGGGGSDASNRILLGRGPSALDVVDAAAGTSLVPAPIAQGPSGGIAGLTVSPDGRRVAGFGGDRSAWVWEAAGGGRKLADAPDPLWYPVARFLSNDRLAIVNETGQCDKRRIYRYAIGRNAIEAVVDVAQKHRFGGHGVLVGNSVILEEVRENDYVRTVVDLTGRAKPYRLPPWRRPPGHRPDLSLRNNALEPGGVTARLTRAYVVDNDDHIHAWDMRAGKVVTQADARYEFVAGLALTPDEKRLLVAYEKGGVSVRVASTLEEERRLEGPSARILTAATSPDGRLAAAAAEDGLFLWRLSDGARVATVDFSAAREAPQSLAFSPDGATLWVGTTLGNLHRFSLRR